MSAVSVLEMCCLWYGVRVVLIHVPESQCSIVAHCVVFDTIEPL